MRKYLILLVLNLAIVAGVYNYLLNTLHFLPIMAIYQVISILAICIYLFMVFYYNNEMEKREQADKKEIARLQSNALAEKYKLARNEARYGYSGAKKDNYLQRLSIARDYFSRLSKEQALAELKANEKLYDYLGLYYNRLHSEILGRRE